MRARADIAAPPERVWELVSDITLMPRLSTELQSVEWAEGFAGPGPGAQFLGTNRNASIGEWTTRSHIVTFDPPRSFGWAVGDPEKPAATWTFVLDPTDGGTRLSYTAEVGPGRSGLTMLMQRSPERAGEILQGRLDQFRASLQATVDGIRERAENLSS